MNQFKALLLFSCALISFQLLGKTTSSVSSGSFITSGNWNNGAPVTGDSINVNHQMYLDVIFDVTGALVIQTGGSLSDTAGGSTYPLQITNTGKLILNGGDLSLEDSILIRNTSSVVIGACDTLTVGGAKLENNTTFTIAACAVFIVNGTFQMENSNGIDCDGFIRINGNTITRNAASITGSGNFSTSGTVTFLNTSSIYGINTNCTPGPCNFGTGFPLPLELLNFGIVDIDGEFHFEWTYIQDEDIKEYRLQRSGDLQMWMDVFQTDSKEQSGSADYRCSDPMPMEHTSYYRLKILSHNTPTAFSQVIEVSQSSNTKQMNAFPNPTTDLIYLSCVDCFYELLDLRSNRLDVFQGGKVDLGHLPSGLYILRSKMGTERITKL